MTDENHFHAMLDANPDDAQTRLVFADWLDEHSDPRAAGYRALGVLRRKPFFRTKYGRRDQPHWHYGWNDDDSWLNHYQSGSEVADDESPQNPSTLPKSWMKLIEGAQANVNAYSAEADSRRAAEDAAALAFAKLPPERQAELLTGQPVGA